MELDKFLFAILVFTTLVVSGVMIIGDLNKNYDGIMQENMDTSEFADTYDTADEIYNLSQDMKTSMMGANVSEDDTSDSMFKGGFKTLKLLQQSFKIIGKIVNAIAGKLGIDKFFITIAMAALTIAIIFGIVYLVFRVAKG